MREFSDFLEQESFGWTHGQAAGIIARGWKLPDRFAEVIESHSDLEDMVEQNTGSLGARAVGLSAMLPSSTDEQWLECPTFLWALEEIDGSGSLDVEAIFAQVDKDYEEFAPALKLTTPSKSLVDYLREESEEE